MGDVIATEVLVNGLRNEFEDTYTRERNRIADSTIGDVMELGISATNRVHEFAYYLAAPHMEYWKRGNPIPAGGFGSVQFRTPVYEWGQRIRWSKWDRKDEQVGDLLAQARTAGESAAAVPTRQFYDILTNGTDLMPAIPLAPDGVALFSATVAGGADRFGVSGGNLLAGSGVATLAAVQADYYAGIEQFKLMQDGQGQPLFNPETVDAGIIIHHAVEETEVFEQAFLQQRQGVSLNPTGSTYTGVTPSNLVQDANRRVTLAGSNRLTGADWYMTMRAAPKKPIFELMRQSPLEFAALEGDNNSDENRTNATEYTQFEMRSGAGIALPYGIIKINN